MGLFRAAMSVSTLGLVSWRNPQQQAAKYTRQTRNAARAQVAQNAMALELQRQQLAATDYANVREEMRPQAYPPGWYTDPGAQGWVRWWDGVQWTQQVQPAAQAGVPAPQQQPQIQYGQPYPPQQYAPQQQLPPGY